MQLKVHKNGGDLFRTADLWCRKQNALPTEPQHLAITSYTSYQIYCILFELKKWPDTTYIRRSNRMKNRLRTNAIF